MIDLLSHLASTPYAQGTLTRAIRRASADHAKHGTLVRMRDEVDMHTAMMAEVGSDGMALRQWEEAKATYLEYESRWTWLPSSACVIEGIEYFGGDVSDGCVGSIMVRYGDDGRCAIYGVTYWGELHLWAD